MKKTTILFSLLTLNIWAYTQPTGYYNGTEGKTGAELKEALNNIISGHKEWAYFFASDVFIESDADPTTPGNVITVYKGSSVDGNDYGTGGDHLNREHVWAKSHGQFGTDLPAGGDLHNLKPADGSVNVARSNKDFDNCQATGQQHDEATGCYFTSNAWEPRDEVKGDIARIIFYMATRYEGENGEIDLEVNDEVNNSPNPFHGRLSALLQWNEQDPPDAFERNRNNVIFSYQQNRNPFIDHPEWVHMIWENESANNINIGNISQSQELVFTSDAITISATITGTGTITANLLWGTTYENQTNSTSLTATGDVFSAQIPPQDTETDIYFTIEATDDNETLQSVPYMYHVEAIFNGTILSIAEVQGESSASPYVNNEVTITGIVTSNFGEGFFVQDEPGEWNGIYVYDYLNPQIGDSVIITGTVKEYYGLTEIVNVSDFYLISRNNELPSPIVLSINQIGEGHEGVLINIPSGTCTSTDEGYGMWEVSDNSGFLKIHNNQVYEFTPSLNETYSITGPCKWDYGEWKIELRKESDITEGNDIILPQVNTVEATSAEYIKITFSESVDEESAGIIENYSINDNITVVDAYRHGGLYSVVYLQVSGMNQGTHEITISNVTDLAGNAVETKTISFTSNFIGLFNHINTGLNIYPNPSDGNFIISGIEGIDEVVISDASGRIVNTIQKTTHKKSMAVNKLKSGLYFIHLNKEHQTLWVSKIIVEP